MTPSSTSAMGSASGIARWKRSRNTLPSTGPRRRSPLSSSCATCAASQMAIGDGLDAIRLGRAEVMLCGGSDAAITRTGIAGFAAELRGQGLAPRALEAMLAWGARELALREANLGCHVDNTASRRVAEKCGFIFVDRQGDELHFRRDLL